MSNHTKILFALIAVVAFVVGFAINKSRVSDVIDSQALLRAKLDYESNPASIDAHLGKVTLVNFWATWCTPCREEMPVFEMMYRAAKTDGFQVIGVAIDNPETAQPMLDSMDITYPIFYAEKTGMTVMETAGNPQGLLPYSLLLDEEGRVIEQVLGKVDEQQIAGWLSTHLPPSISSSN